MKKAFSLIATSWVILLVFASEGAKTQSMEKKVDNDSTKSASFPGGISALFKFLADSVKYPKNALAHPTKHKIGIQITVNQNGDISQVITPPGLRKDFEVEARRVVSKMPKWSPLIENGIPKTSTVFFYIRFIPPK